MSVKQKFKLQTRNSREEELQEETIENKSSPDQSWDGSDTADVLTRPVDRNTRTAGDEQQSFVQQQQNPNSSFTDINHVFPVTAPVFRPGQYRGTRQLVIGRCVCAEDFLL